MTEFPHQGPTPEFPHRPDHPDFDILSALITGLDGEVDRAAAEGRRFDLGDFVAQYIDPKSLAYLAMQRAIRLMNAYSSADILERREEMFRLATMYHEGFVMGTRFQQTKASASKPSKKNRRSGDPRKRAQS